MTARRISGAGPIALLTIGVVAALLYANFFIAWVLSDFTGMGHIVSDLEAPGEPNAVLLRVTDVVCAVLVVTLLPWVRAALRPGWWREIVVWGTVVFALGAAIAAFVPAPCGPGVACDGADQQLQITIHDGSSILSDTALYVGVAAAWFATRPSGPRWLHRIAWWVFWLGGLVASVLFEFFNVTNDPPWAVGASQRVHILFISVWIVCLSVLAATEGVRTGTERGPHRSDRLVLPIDSRGHEEPRSR